MMSVVDIIESAQYVVDEQGKQTAVLLDLENWVSLRRLLEELAEDERLGELLAEVEEDDMLDGNAAREAYHIYRKFP
jgi:PHD/YefM family antitoxin component YafN of YafNO toxin-antitoxin module